MTAEKFLLCLADFSSWEIAGGNDQGRFLAARLAGAMSLRSSPDAPRIRPSTDANGNRTRSLLIKGEKRPIRWQRLPRERMGRIVCRVGPILDDEMSMVHLLNIGQLLAAYCEPLGGLLLHAALVCKGDDGVLLLGGSGSGKTTASRRIPAPWRACCDDYTLVVRDPQGDYWAHPWPTWSRFFQGGSGGSWQAGTAVRLRAIFFLQPGAAEGWANPVKRQPIVKIMESVEQATWSTTASLEKVRQRSVRLRRLGNAINLAKVVPCFQLRLTLAGKFWETMDETLGA